MSAERRPSCAIVIPTYRGAALLKACIDAILGSPPTGCDWEIVVVDDGSGDETELLLEEYGGQVLPVIFDRNRGFASACNAGAAASAAEYLVFLNNDTLPTGGWLDALVQAAQTVRDGVAFGSRLLFPDDTVQHAGICICADRWPRHIYAGFPGDHPAVTRPRQVVAVTAACMLVRRSAFDAVGGFDTSFHNGYEDIDLCLRMAQLGGEIHYCPASVLYHLESVTRWPDGPEIRDENVRLFDERWRGRITPDDVGHYLDDGLVELEYGPYYPLRLSVSPLLATIDREDPAVDGLESLLARRSRQVMELQSAGIRSDLAKLQTRTPPPLPLRSGRPVANPELLHRGSFRPLGGSGTGTRVSLLLPVKNEAESLAELLPLVLEQEVHASLEIVAIDSGSDDDTVSVLAEFGATVVRIRPEDFDHGLTRNLAAENANGEILLFMNGRTRPADGRWLAALLGAVQNDATVVGACSRVVAHPSAHPLDRRDSERDLSGSPRRERKEIRDWSSYNTMPVEQRRVFLNFHTVSTAIRADLFRRIPFRAVRTIGEDLLWAREVLEAGWALVHEPTSLAYHSHEYPVQELFMRNVDDGIANRDINGRALDWEVVEQSIATATLEDWRFLEQTMPKGQELEREKLRSALRRTAQMAGQWLGASYETLPDGAAAAFSRIATTRRQGNR